MNDKFLPDYPFTTDGCSGGMSKVWKLFSNKPTPWESCCVSHDYDYWKGGTEMHRLRSDFRLYHCVKSRGYPGIALIMYYSVRIFGHRYWLFSWRWGYNKRHPLNIIGRWKRKND